MDAKNVSFGAVEYPSEDDVSIDLDVSEELEEPESGNTENVIDNLTQDEQACVLWVRNRISVSGYEDEQWKNEHTRSVIELLYGDAVRRLFIFVDSVVGLCVQYSLPSDSSIEFMYFVRSPGVLATSSNISEVIQYGLISSSALDSLYKLMNSVYGPLFLEGSAFTELYKKDFTGQFHKFMASLTETAHRAKGTTALYVPNEDINSIEDAAKDKNLVQRLECALLHFFPSHPITAALIHWTRQIKELLGHHDHSEQAENVGPLYEVQFWKSRTEDLSGISEQLRQSGVGKIVAVLETAKSSYLAPFHKLSDLIEAGSIEAEDNIKFLNPLLPSCIQLANADPSGIPEALPKLLDTIRMIWGLSRFYNTSERMTGLLRKVSSEIINRCCKYISLDHVFHDDVIASMTILRQSVEAGEVWKMCYNQTSENIASRSSVAKWNFDESSIFAQVDAFIMRCRDLMEVCEAQVQFARCCVGGKKAPMPVFGGSRGQEIARALHDIESAFDRLLNNLANVSYDILDVKTTKWHDDYSTFKQGVKDLEVMMRNVISSAFEKIGSVHDGVELLRVFHKLAIRESVKRMVEKKTVEIWSIFQTDLDIVRRDFDQWKRAPPLQRSHPPAAGAAFWARSLLSRIEGQATLLENAAAVIIPTREADEAKTAYSRLRVGIESFIQTTHTEWSNALISNDNLRQLLNNTLLIQGENDYIECNFHKTIIHLFAEMTLWKQMNYDIPNVGGGIWKESENLRILRQNTLLLVTDFNSILNMLSPSERRLFDERIDHLKTLVEPGFSQLTWQCEDKEKILAFVQNSREECRVVKEYIYDFKSAVSYIDEVCQRMRDTRLIDLEKKKVYSQQGFEERQEAYRNSALKRLQDGHGDIITTVRKIYEVFKDAGEGVQREWASLVKGFDTAVEEMLRQTVRKSIQCIDRAINGDSHSEPQPLFGVQLVLESLTTKATYISKPQVFFRPSMDDMIHMVTSVCSEIVSAISLLPRLIEVVEDEMSFKVHLEPMEVKKGHCYPPKGYHLLIKNDDDVLKIILNITNGMNGLRERLQKYIDIWGTSYKDVWDIDKDAFIRRYMRTHAVTDMYLNIDADINRYRIQQQLIQNEETSTSMQYIQIDCSPLKNSLIQHCTEWMTKFTTLLNQVASKELHDLHDLFSSSTVTLKKPPSSLWDMGDSLSTVKSLEGQLEDIEARFEPLHAHYGTLEKWEVAVTDEENELLALLPGAWDAFRQMLRDTERMLDSYKERFKAELLNGQESFLKGVSTLREEFHVRAPYESVVSVERAFDILNGFKEEIKEWKEREAEIRKGLQIFGLEQLIVKDLPATIKELELLEKIWKLTSDWNKMWDKWRMSQFLKLNSQDLEDAAASFLKKVTRMREIKHWDVWVALKDRIDQFRRTLPLISDLRNRAMRDRHWDALQEEIGKSFDPHSDSFTLEFVLELGLDNFAEVVIALSSSATQELAIEEALEGLEVTWSSTDLDIAPYKDDYFKLRSADEIFQILEDHQVTLSAMKNSPYYSAFEQQVEMWEKTLSRILETVELIILVQRSWMYQENIFVGSADIRRQLPTESALFDGVNTTWKFVMGEIAKNRNVLKSTGTQGVQDMLVDMSDKLDRIQKCLDQYLETKRRAFPRFYFISNDDLLEILGQARDPNAVQPHLKKCFDNIKSLVVHPPGIEGRRSWEASDMVSSDGETVRFNQPLQVEGPAETWLARVVTMMKATLHRQLSECLQEHKKVSRSKLIKDWPGQLLITAGQIIWTMETTKALADLEKGDRSALKVLRKQQNILLSRLAALVQGPLSQLQRLKINALLTIEVHARDVIERLIHAKCNSPASFDWLSQLRFYFDKDRDECVIRQTNTQAKYGYEYLGNSGRLVVTPLTDRCYMTMTMAMHLKLGGAPQGPAGTGKTETVKDLGKSLAKLVIVFNCSEGLDFKSLGRMFSGLAQTGAWSCFDEFNRIDIEVLSVVAQQIQGILNAIMNNAARFVFEGAEIPLDSTCGFFVTMNPGYAGRTELPDNLKSLFRPVSMMVPDAALIAEIMLFSEGFPVEKAKALSKKVVTLYQLSIQQLSKQDHYDFGLRAIKSVLVAAGELRRQEPEWTEELVLLKAMRDMNLPKLVAEDVDLFVAIMGDLFPGADAPMIEAGVLQAAIEDEMREEGLQVHQVLVEKIIQLDLTKKTRHGVMLVGEAGSGKTTAWKTLRRAYGRLKKQGVEGFHGVRSFVLNPKALTLGELFGDYDINTREWVDGVLSAIMRTICTDEKEDQKWMVLDGPVDTTWIESMNTVLDDNKMLTLINSERISLSDTVSLLFEVADLSEASPATISRVGMVYLEASDLGWKPFATSWLAQHEDKVLAENLEKLFNRCVQPMLDFKKANCKEPVPITDLNAVTTLCRLFDSLATLDNGVNPSDSDFYSRMIELWFVFCLIWSIGAAVDDEGRGKIDMFVREIEGQFPTTDTVYEYYVDSKKRTWAHWADKLPQQWRYPNDTPFHKILVPTVDTVCTSFLLQSMIKAHHHVLITGTTGVGKTTLIQNVLTSMDDRFSNLTLNFSSRTSSDRTQRIVDGAVEKRTKEVYVPIGGKKLIVFVDDLNMPAKDKYGSQPPLELLRQWIDHQFWYDKQHQTPKYIQGMQLVAAMGHPGGGRQVISTRLQNRFYMLNITFPDNKQIIRIFETMITQKLNDFEEEIKPLAPHMVKATVELYQQVVQEMLPTPQHSHYSFNLRDLSKVFQGIMCADRNYYDVRDSIIRLWIHESIRVFHDRLIDDSDRNWLVSKIHDKLSTHFNVGWNTLLPSEAPPVFGAFMREGMETEVYEEITDMEALKSLMDEKMEDYNLEPRNINMNLVLFKDAIGHVCRIHRIIRLPRGNALLVGVGGSGRQSLTRLAASIAGFEVFYIELRRTYRFAEWHEDLKRLYWQVGVEKTPTVFLFSDTQILEEGFLEDVSNILSSGQVPNLYTNDELSQIFEIVREDARAANIPENLHSLFNYFIERVRANLHVVLCMSPVGDEFRNRLRMFPALINCATIDWFTNWPDDALKEVGVRFLEPLQVQEGDNKEAIVSFFMKTHQFVSELSDKMYREVKRRNYATPTSYLELVSGYCELLAKKRDELTDAAEKLRSGLNKLDETRVQVQEMSRSLVDKKLLAAKAQKECEDLLVVIVQERRVAEEQARQVGIESDKLGSDEEEIRAQAEAAQAELEVAAPALEAATKALETLTKKDIAEIRAYLKPPPLVEYVMMGVLIVTKKEPTWAFAKREMNDPTFLNHLMTFDKENMSDTILKKIERIISDPQFQPDIVGKVSFAARGLCMWVRAIHAFGLVYRDVKPKQNRVKSAIESLAKKQGALRKAKEKLQDVTDKVVALKRQYDESVATKETLRRETEEIEIKLSRAEALISGLASERVRWEASIVEYEGSHKNCVGDCLVASAFLSYAGPFPSDYRHQLVEQFCIGAVRNLKIPFSENLSMKDFLGVPTTIREWQIQGLPTDRFSTENGILSTCGRRWPLIIDPQSQANYWIKVKEQANSLAVVDLNMPDYLRTLENSIKFGTPVLIQDVQETLDPSLDPILTKAVIKQSGRLIIKLGDKEVDYDPNFTMFLTTKRANPRFSPEIATKTTVVNFAVKEKGLEDQLLGIVIRKERPELEEQKDQLVLSIAAAKKKLVDLEGEILGLLSSATGSLLEDEALVNALQGSKTTSEEIKEQLAISEMTEAKIDSAREQYRPIAARAAILFFVLSSLGNIDPMYQFSLSSYIELFKSSVEKAPNPDALQDRIHAIVDTHTYAVYKYTCRALFEKHKLLFSFFMCVKILMGMNKINMEEYGFFLRGGQVLDKDTQKRNPCHQWLPESTWDNVTEMDKLASFSGIAQSFDGQEREWKEWYFSAEPENTPFPGEWENKLNELQRMTVIRCLRADRVAHCVTHFITTQPDVGPRFVEPPVFDLEQAFEDSNNVTPLVFVLSPGVDPTGMLTQLAEKRGMKQYLRTLALGQGQAHAAARLIDECARTGKWCFLANADLMLSWMPQLEKIVAALPSINPHVNFRLWISSSPHKDFPISILMSSLKLTTEPPRGLKANLLRLYNLITPDRFNKCSKPEKYKNILFALAFFHSVMLERRKFLSLGFNNPYDFNDADFLTSETVVSMYLDEYETTPWEALKYIIAEVNYGGRVTEELDRKLLRVYASSYFRAEVLESGFQLSDLATYSIPEDGPLQSYRDYILSLHSIDKPEAFGQHQNADIASQMGQTKILLDSLLTMTPQAGLVEGSESGSGENAVYELAAELLERMPEMIPIEQAKQVYANTSNPINMVLVHESIRYNKMLSAISASLVLVQRGIKGHVAMSTAMEEMHFALQEGKVPEQWQKEYPSVKPLASWARDLIKRITFFREWAETGVQPKVFWLGGFTFPTGFLTAVLQMATRQFNVSIDSLAWEFAVINTPEQEIEAPKEGVLIKGIHLEGASWNMVTNSLEEPGPLELTCDMPIIHFKPVESKRRQAKAKTYSCPCYAYPVRVGTREKPSYIVNIDVKCGSFAPEKWTKRGTAMLLSLGT